MFDAMGSDVETTLAGLGDRLRSLRRVRGITLERLARLTGTSVSTLSRVEAGKRRPTLDLLLPIAAAYGIPVDDLIGAPRTGDPRIHPKPVLREGVTWIPLHQEPGGLNAYKQVLPVDADPTRPLRPQVHEGREWLYVLTGELRLVLDGRDLSVHAGEAAEFDTRTPHAMINAAQRPTELIIIFGQQGQHVHLTGSNP